MNAQIPSKQVFRQIGNSMVVNIVILGKIARSVIRFSWAVLDRPVLTG
jgi:hypothetical protein